MCTMSQVLTGEGEFCELHLTVSVSKFVNRLNDLYQMREMRIETRETRETRRDEKRDEERRVKQR